MAIHFFTEDVDEIEFPKRKVSSWIRGCITNNGKKTGDINYIFCSDNYLLEMNIQYLKHDYYTDIITFNYNEKNTISGDIYISIDRISDNASQFDVEFFDELLRVIIHGILHLVGFNDDTLAHKEEIRLFEDKWVQIYKNT